MGWKGYRKDLAGQNIPAASGETIQLTIHSVSPSGLRHHSRGSPSVTEMTTGAGRLPSFSLSTGDSAALSLYTELSPLPAIVTTLLDHKYGLALSHLPCLPYIRMLHFPKLIPAVPRIAAHSIRGNLPSPQPGRGGLGRVTSRRGWAEV